MPTATSFIIEHHFPDDKREEFLKVEKSLDDAVRKASGCQSVSLEELPSERKGQLHYRTTMLFDSQDALLGWVASDLRQKLVHEARESFQYGYALSSHVGGFDSWFPAPEEKKPPAAWKMNLLVLLTLYPTVLGLRPLLHPLTQGMDFATNMLVGNIASVSLTGWVLIPLANKLYGPWIHSGKRPLLAPISAVLILGLVWFFNRG